MNSSIQEYWQRFLETRPDLLHLSSKKPDAWSFGNTPEMADDLVKLVLEGKKTATSSLMSVYRSGLEPMPVLGSYQIILDGKNNPRCVIYLTETFIKKFCDITEKHAFEEGEGDRTLSYWREVHKKFFSSYPDFNEDSEVLCERFKLVHKF